MTDYRAQSKVNPRLKESLRAGLVWHVRDLKIVRDQMDSKFMREEKRLFASEGASGGKRWKPIDPKSPYGKHKRRKKPGRKVMVYGGDTRKKFVQKGPDHVATYAAKPRPSVTLGADSEVAAYHIKPKPGVPNPHYNKRLPNRDAMQMTRKQEKGYLQIMWDYILEHKGPKAQKILAAWRKANAPGFK